MKILILISLLSVIAFATAKAKENNCPLISEEDTLATKEAVLGLAPSHIAAPPQRILNNPQEWKTTAEFYSLYKFYAGQINGPAVFTQFEPGQLISAMNCLNLDIGVEFGSFGLYGGKNEGAKSAENAIKRLQPIFNSGKPIKSLHLDGPIRRMIKEVKELYGEVPAKEIALDLDDISKEMAVFFKEVHKHWPALEIGLIVNLPNWDYNEKLRGSIGIWTDSCGIYYEDVLNQVYDVLTEAGERLAFIEIDCPYNYYIMDKTGYGEAGPCDTPEQFRLIQNWCRDREVKLNLVINAYPYESVKESDLAVLESEEVDAANLRFREGVLDYIRKVRNDGVYPDLMMIQSWYRAPVKNLPETEKGTFMNTALEAAKLIRTLNK
jgi:hypothetical protein